VGATGWAGHLDIIDMPTRRINDLPPRQAQLKMCTRRPDDKCHVVPITQNCQSAIKCRSCLGEMPIEPSSEIHLLVREEINAVFYIL
jgi:hypothetical protein